jgi:hypothetical protein
MISTNRSLLSTLCLSAFLCANALAQQTSQSRTVGPAGVTGDLIDIQKANDGNSNTRATSGKTEYVGMSVTIDIGGMQNIIGVKQDFGPWATHYPGKYKVELAESLSGPWMTAFEGAGERGESRAEWPAILARYVRITATGKNTTYPGLDWSIGELKLGVDPGQTARRIVAQLERPPDRPPTNPKSEPTALKDVALATDKKVETRASSGTANYEGMFITIDLGGEYELTRVVQVHGRWAEEFPAEYKVEVSRQANENRFREVWRGAGKADRSVARFEPVVTRYIRITALKIRGNNHQWSIAELRTNRDPDVVDNEDDDRTTRQIREVTSQGFINAANVSDDKNTTRATTNRANYAGSWLQADLGGSYTISKMLLVHDPDREDYARRYKVEVSGDGRQWQQVFDGRGEPGRSTATFNPVRARFVRITAIAERDSRQWWSIYRLKISG